MKFPVLRVPDHRNVLNFVLPGTEPGTSSSNAHIVNRSTTDGAKSKSPNECALHVLQEEREEHAFCLLFSLFMNRPKSKTESRIVQINLNASNWLVTASKERDDIGLWCSTSDLKTSEMLL